MSEENQGAESVSEPVTPPSMDDVLSATLSAPDTPEPDGKAAQQEPATPEADEPGKAGKEPDGVPPSPDKAEAEEPQKPDNWAEVNKLLKEQREEIKALRKEQAERTEAQKQEPEDPEPDRYEDEDKWFAWRERQITRNATEAARKAAREEAIAERAETSLEKAREQYEDFDAVMGEDFANAAEFFQSRPDLQKQIMDQRDPYGFMYRELKKEAERAELNDPSAYKAKLREELKAEILAELKGEQPDSQHPTRDQNGRFARKDVQLPPSVTEAPNDPPKTKSGYSGRTPLDAIPRPT